MDKNNIKNRLSQRFVKEDVTPGITVTAAANKESGKINKAGLKDIEKNIASYEKPLTSKDKDSGKMAQNKFNYDSKFEKTYHDEMEIMNGQEMLQYDSKPNEEFVKKSKEGIEGSSRMGNEGGKGVGNAEAAWGASSDDFGKNHVKNIKASQKKRSEQTPTLNLRGRDIQADLKDTGHRPYALDEMAVPKKPISDKNKMVLTNWVDKMGAKEAATKLINGLSQTGMISDLPDSLEYGQGVNKVEALLAKADFDNAYHTAKSLATRLEKKAMKDMGMFENKTKPKTKPKATAPENDGEDYEKISREVEYGINPNNDNNNNPQIKESMKRLKFKKEFNGVGNALKLIPEGYRVDAKEFEMTDGNETYRIRWEGTLSEGRAVVITAADTKMINEDIARMKALFGYKSQDTLGLVKGNARIDENKVFGDIWNKTKKLLGESEEIDGQTAPVETKDDAGINQAKDAKKNIQGSVSTDKGTTAPKPKTGNWEDNVKGVAKEATKHIEGSASTDDGGVAPAPKNGEWEEITKKAPEATKHMETGTATHKATAKAKVVTENEDEEDIDLPTEPEDDSDVDVEDDFNKPDLDDDGDTDAEPSSIPAEPELDVNVGDDEDEINVPVPAKTGGATILFSQKTGEYWLKSGDNTTKVPDAHLSMAADKSKSASERAASILAAMQDAADNDMGDDFDPEDDVITPRIREYGDEHAVAGKVKPEIDEMFGGGDKLRAIKATEFDIENAKLKGTKGDQTHNKDKWLDRAENTDNYKGQFLVDRGVLQYKSRSTMPATGGSSGYGTANESK